MVPRFIALLVLLATLLIPTAAMASTTSPAPTGSPSPTGEGAPPAVDGPAVTINLTDRSNLDAEGNPTPVAGVTLTVVDAAGTEVGEGVTGEDGRAVIPVEERGQHTVRIEEDTLPEGISLDEDTPREVTVNVILDGPFNVAAFPIGVVEGETDSFLALFEVQLVSGIKSGLIIALAALGLSLIFGATGLTNFAHGELVTLGGIFTYMFDVTLGLGVIVGGILAVILCGAFGWAQDKALWQPLRNRGTGLIAMMIVSIGLGLALRSIYQYAIGSRRVPLSQYTTQQRQDFGIVELAWKEVAIVVIAVVAIAVVCITLMKTRMGKAMRAVSDNPALSASSGMRVDSVIRTAWILGTALAGLAGVLFTLNQQLNFQMGFKLLLMVFAAVTLGGLGTIWGALFGGLVIGIMTELGPIFGVPSSIKEVGALAILILILLIRPQGILGRRERIG